MCRLFCSVEKFIAKTTEPPSNQSLAGSYKIQFNTHPSEENIPVSSWNNQVSVGNVKYVFLPTIFNTMSTQRFRKRP